MTLLLASHQGHVKDVFLQVLKYQDKKCGVNVKGGLKHKLC